MPTDKNQTHQTMPEVQRRDEWNRLAFKLPNFSARWRSPPLSLVTSQPMALPASGGEGAATCVCVRAFEGHASCNWWPLLGVAKSTFSPVLLPLRGSSSKQSFRKSFGSHRFYHAYIGIRTLRFTQQVVGGGGGGQTQPSLGSSPPPLS